MTATMRLPFLLLVAALSAAIVPPLAAIGAIVVILVAWAVDVRAARGWPQITRTLPHIVSRGRPVEMIVASRGAKVSRLRQPRIPDVRIEPASGRSGFAGSLQATRRGRHVLPPISVRVEGPLGIGAWNHDACGENAELLVYPDMVAAQRIVVAVRNEWFREAGRRTRGRLAVGTDFESIRDYLPDDDIRQVNWRATARTGKPMSNQYRVDQDRDVICVVDTGRLMASPLGRLTRLDVAVDAASAVAMVADELGDRCGAFAFDAQVRRRLPPRRNGGEPVVRSLFDLEPVSVESDYELAFRMLGGMKRAFVVLFTDLLEESAAMPLLRAVPVLTRRHVVAVASVADTDLLATVRTPPKRPVDVYEAAVALDVLGARSRVVANLRARGVDVVEAAPDELGVASVAAYLRAKSRARL